MFSYLPGLDLFCFPRLKIMCFQIRIRYNVRKTNKKGDNMSDVCICSCADYDPEHVRAALMQAVSDFLPQVRQGMTIAVKTNLVSAMPPEKAATTHPAILRELCRLLTERGASVVIGDSPGNLFVAPVLHHAYKVCGLEPLVREGVCLNEDLGITEVEFPNAVSAKQFSVTSYLLKADMIINCCKFKTHGMMEITCAAKNMFGSIPGTMKPEYHFRFKDADAFANMIVDVNEYLKPALCICDAVTAMEGNGPTAGSPKEIGVILAAESPHKLDLAAAHLVGLDPQRVPTLRAAISRGLCPEHFSDLDVSGDGQDVLVADFLFSDGKRDIQFRNKGSDRQFVSSFLRFVLKSKPVLHKRHCVGCCKCANICPAKAITMKNGKPRIDRKKYIRCFCCQEFCPRGAMRVHRTWLARLLTVFSKKTKAASSSR